MASMAKQTVESPAPNTTGLKYAQAAAAGVSSAGSQDTLAKQSGKTEDKGSLIPYYSYLHMTKLVL